jgi:hypothetical protein
VGGGGGGEEGFCNFRLAKENLGESRRLKIFKSKLLHFDVNRSVQFGF